jgi:4-hydroxythreonine-4-phosphate dehydrogenase
VTARHPRPLLAVSMGDPVGIGPEVVAKALTVPQVRADTDLAVFGDATAMMRAAETAHLRLRVREIGSVEEARDTMSDEIPVLPVSRLAPGAFVWAEPTPDSDRAQLEYVKSAVRAVRDRRADALVTAPISKASIRRAGAPWPGHTELLGDLLAPSEKPAFGPVMMLASDQLRVVPLTTHIPLVEVPRVLNPDLVLHGIRVTHRALMRYFSCPRPRIAVAGLNPHASENGLFGSEEARVIAPAIGRAHAEGISASGPLPADTVFRRAVEGEFDAVIGMYHDQALIPIKLLDFDRAVNVTLGLPIIRTSVDHGTAYDLAGKGVASAGSMLAAIRLAANMVRARERSG